MMDCRVKPGNDAGESGKSPQELHRIDRLLLQLVQRALTRRLVGAPAQDGGAVAETLAAEMVVADFHHQLRLQWAPLRGALGRPAARAARRVAGEAWLADQRFELCSQRQLLLALDCGSEADMMQQPPIIVQTEQQRADHLLARKLVGRVAKAANDAIGAAKFLDLLHAVAVAGLIRQVETLGDHAAGAAAPRPPPACASHFFAVAKLVVAGDSRNVGCPLNCAFANASSTARRLQRRSSKD